MGKKLLKKVVESYAKNSTNSCFCWLLHQPKAPKSLIKKFLYNQEINLEHKITSVEEIREDIVNMVDKRSILKKISRYNHKLDKLLYSINRELGMK